jgi:alkylation response protein AidB-like acyl-CoA dehydrogenase
VTPPASSLARSNQDYPAPSHEDRPSASALAAKADILTEAFAETAALHDETGEVPADNLQAIFEAGFLRLIIPQSDGGWAYGLSEAISRKTPFRGPSPAGPR